jgi:hypothetical protein
MWNFELINYQLVTIKRDPVLLAILVGTGL